MIVFCRGDPKSGSHASVGFRTIGENGSMIRKMLVDETFEVGSSSQIMYLVTVERFGKVE